MNEQELREALAAYAHEAWSGWMRYLFDRGELHPDGSFTIPVELVLHWQRQMRTPYMELPEDEKRSDRKEADEMLAIFAQSHAAALLRDVEAIDAACTAKGGAGSTVLDERFIAHELEWGEVQYGPLAAALRATAAQIGAGDAEPRK